MIQESMGYAQKGKFTTSVKRVREDPAPPKEDIDQIFREADEMLITRKHSIDPKTLPF